MDGDERHTGQPRSSSTDEEEIVSSEQRAAGHAPPSEHVACSIFQNLFWAISRPDLTRSTFLTCLIFVHEKTRYLPLSHMCFIRTKRTVGVPPPASGRTSRQSSAVYVMVVALKTLTSRRT